MAQQLSKGIKQTAVYGVTTTTANSTLYSDYVDMANYNGCMFTFLFKSTGASTGTAALTIVQPMPARPPPQATRQSAVQP